MPFRVAVVLFCLSLLSACATTSSNNSSNTARSQAYQACNAQYPAEKRTAQNAVPYAKCMMKVVATYGDSELVQLITMKRLELAEKLKNGRISLAEYQHQFKDYAYQIKVQQQILENQKKIAKNTECISERQRVAGNDYSGVNSTSGAVAVISLLAAVSDGMSVAAACN